MSARELMFPPPTERGEKRMAHATLESSARSRAGVLTMPRLQYPATCGSPACAHPMCTRLRLQASLPCAECFQVIWPGEKFIERKVEHGRVIEQVHAICPERTP